MSVIAEKRPRFTSGEAAELARTLYGVSGTLRALPSERDQNFLLTAGNGEMFVLKISGAGEQQSILELQHAALDHLAARYDVGRGYLESFQSVHARAIGAFLFLSANQFFWDGNKRTGRLLMNGVLLSAGMDAIAVPARRQQEFNETMIRFYDTSDAAVAIPFLVSCSLDRTLRIGDAPASGSHDG